jgi:hypothetical protein
VTVSCLAETTPGTRTNSATPTADNTICRFMDVNLRDRVYLTCTAEMIARSTHQTRPVNSNTRKYYKRRA